MAVASPFSGTLLYAVDELLAQGVTRDQVRHKLRTHQWLLADRAVIFAGSAFQGDRERAWAQSMAAVLSAAPGRVAVSHTTAAFWWGLLRDPPVRVYITVEPTCGVRSRGGVQVVRRALVGVPTARIAGLPVTGLARTLVDAAAELPELGAVDLLEQAWRRRLLPAGQRPSPPPGSRQAKDVRRAFALAEPLSESHLETVLRLLMIQAAIAGLVCQHEVVTPAGRFRLDFAFPGLRLAMEVDGFAHHSSREQLDRDHARSNALSAAGWTVLRFGWSVIQHHPERVIAEIQTALKRATA